METRVWSDPRVLKMMKEDYVVCALFADDKKTLPVMLATLASQSFSKADAGQIWMVTFLAILPIVVVYLLLSKYIIKGVTSGSVKG